MNFVTIDFETANQQRYSACSLALIVVRNSQIQDELYSLINPQTSFDQRNVQIHGIHKRDVADAPTFPELWKHIRNFFTPNQLVVAHNATFDNTVLKNTLNHYKIQTPTYLTLDTLRTSRQFFPDLPNYRLNTICNFFKIDLHHHHNALDDARACTNLLLHQENNFGIQALSNFIKATH